MNVIVHLRDSKKRRAPGPPAIRATLVKHPEFKTPRTVILGIDRTGVDLLGRETPSFRQLYEAEIAKLQSGHGFSNSLRDLEHRNALRLLLEEAWGPEHAAMANSELPTVMDALNLTANVHNRKLIKMLERKVAELQKRLDESMPKTKGGTSQV